MRRHVLVAIALSLPAILPAACGSPVRASVGRGPASTSSGTTPPTATSTTGPATAATTAPASPSPPTTRPKSFASIATTKMTVVMTPPIMNIALTAADDRQTFPVTVGSTVTLTLDGAQTQWGPIAVTPDGLLAARTPPTPPAHGAAGAWSAAHPGTVQLKATGTAYCPPNAQSQPVACPLYAQAYAATLVIY